MPRAQPDTTSDDRPMPGAGQFDKTEYSTADLLPDFAPQGQVSYWSR